MSSPPIPGLHSKKAFYLRLLISLCFARVPLNDRGKFSWIIIIVLQPDASRWSPTAVAHAWRSLTRGPAGVAELFCEGSRQSPVNFLKTGILTSQLFQESSNCSRSHFKVLSQRTSGRSRVCFSRGFPEASGHVSKNHNHCPALPTDASRCAPNAVTHAWRSWARGPAGVAGRLCEGSRQLSLPHKTGDLLNRCVWF